jgi:hypothetical protein
MKRAEDLPNTGKREQVGYSDQSETKDEPCAC